MAENQISVTVDRFAAVETKVASHAEQLRSLSKRIDDNDEITKGIHRLVTNVEVYAQRVEHLADKMEGRMTMLEERQMKQGERIGALESKPAKRWEQFIGTIITALVSTGVGALIGYLISNGL